MKLEHYNLSIEAGRKLIFERACRTHGMLRMVPPSNLPSLQNGFMDQPEIQAVTFQYNLKGECGTTHGQAINLDKWYNDDDPEILKDQDYLIEILDYINMMEKQ